MSSPNGGDGGHPGGGHPSRGGGHHQNSNIMPHHNERGHYPPQGRQGYGMPSQQHNMVQQSPHHHGQMPPGRGGYMRDPRDAPNGPGGPGQGPSNGQNWQNADRDVGMRRDMITRIISLLRERKPDARDDWINKLPEMAKKLEDRLYHCSQSRDEYNNVGTLTSRLQRIAMQITHDRAQQRQRAQQGQGHPGLPGPGPNHQQGPGGGPPHGRPHSQMSHPPPPQMNRQYPQHHDGGHPSGPPHHSGPPNQNLGGSNYGQGPPPNMPRAGSSMMQHQSSMGNYGDPMRQNNLSRQSQGYPPNAPGHGPMSMSGRGSVTPTNHMYSPPPPGAGHYGGPDMHRGGRPPPHAPSPVPSRSETGGGSGGPPGQQNAADAQRQRNLVLRQQQHRLLLLRHASRCTYPEDSCPATSQCGAYKKLWVHIASCREKHCETPHCVSSRYVLSHYHRCQQKDCQVCSPVREAIDKHNRIKMQQQQRNGGPVPSASMNRPPGPGQNQFPDHGSDMHFGPPSPSPPPPSGMGNRHPQYPPYHSQGASSNPNVGTSRALPPHIADHSARNSPVSSLQGGYNNSMDHGFGGSMGGLNDFSNFNPPVEPAASNPPNEDRREVDRRIAELNQRRRAIEEKKRREAQKEQEIEEELRRLKSLQNPGAASSGGAPAATSSGATVPPLQPAAIPAAAAAPKPRSMSQMPEEAIAQANKRRAVRPNEMPGSAPAGSMMAPHASPINTHTAMIQHTENKKKRLLAAMQTQSSLVYTFDIRTIEAHVKSLSASCCSSSGAHTKQADVRQRALQIIKNLLDQEHSWIFSKPVDPIQLDIPDYFDVVKKPMDLGTIKKNIENNGYKSLRDFATDVRLTFNNAMLYNAEGSEVHKITRQFGCRFEKDYNTMMRQMREEEALKRRNENACRLCGGEKYTFEPPVYYCNGKCNQKIRRSAFFYVTPDNKQFYCLSCYNSCLKDLVTLEDGNEITKDKLKKKKNDEVQEESWVECNGCKRWYHQICVLFNGRRNDQSRNEPYFCPICVLRFIEQLRMEKLPQPKDVRFSAEDLPKTGYSDFLEFRVARRVQMTREAYAKQHKLPIWEVENVGEINIRVVSCKDTELFPRQGLERMYGGNGNYPKSFPHKVKCILLFEKIDGVDVLILGLYTQVYGSDCPAPNTRTLYIAYLDSVYYFTPAFCRTPVYHELLESTLEYEKKRGITKTFIWVCPPLAGDDYILYCHPKDQKTPKAEMLRSWYFQLLENSRKRGVVVSMDNLYDVYLQRVCNVSEVPNFDGDYWPGVTEQFIEQLESEKVDPKSIAPRKKRVYSRNKHLGTKGKNSKSKKRTKAKGKKQTKTKKKAKKMKSKRKAAGFEDSAVGNEAQDTGDDGEANETEGEDATDTAMELTAESFMPPRPLPSLELPQQDALTVKIADVIQQMKEDFMVVYMHHICAGCCKDMDKHNEIYWLPERYDPAKLNQDYGKARYAPPFALCDECYRERWTEEYGPDNEPSYDNIQTEKIGCWDDDFETSKGLGIGKDQDTQDDDNVQEAVTAAINMIITSIEQSEIELDVGDNNELFMDKIEQKEIGDNEVDDSNDMEIEGENYDKTSEQGSQPPMKAEEDNENLDGEDYADVKSESGNLSVKDEEESELKADVQKGLKKETTVKIKEEKNVDIMPASSPKAAAIEDIITVLPPGQSAGRRSAWLEAPCGLHQMVPFRTNVAEETIDTDPIMDCQFFDTRQQFLSLCQGNRYQFDQLRRAKHSSMMVLYHLHNPDLPSFIHSCNNCRMDIAKGHRYSCRECDDFDLCETCIRQVQHHHPLVCVTDPNAAVYHPGKKPNGGVPGQGYPGSSKNAKANGVMPGYPGNGYPGQPMQGAGRPMYPENRGLRVQAHMALLVHASDCNRQDCENKNCFRMRQLLQHGAKCPEKSKCKICRRIWSLLHVHARQCRVRGRCSVPSCDNLRAHLRRVAAQSQDRRIRMQTQRMQQERVQQQQMAHGGPPTGHHDDRQASPNMDLQRNSKTGKHIR